MDHPFIALVQHSCSFRFVLGFRRTDIDNEICLGEQFVIPILVSLFNPTGFLPLERNSCNKFDTGITLDEAVMAYVEEVLDGKITAETYGEPQGRVTQIVAE